MNWLMLLNELIKLKIKLQKPEHKAEDLVSEEDQCPEELLLK
jgi:hypothetical protein